MKGLRILVFGSFAFVLALMGNGNRDAFAFRKEVL